MNSTNLIIVGTFDHEGIFSFVERKFRVKTAFIGSCKWKNFQTLMEGLKYRFISVFT
jgi:hypothetical protein